jgi:steroid 5-alpha reductase family enzyme
VNKSNLDIKMKNTSIFVITLIISIAILIVATIVGFSILTSAQNPYNWMSQMWGGHSGSIGGMGGMMGEPTTNIPTNSLLTIFGSLYAILIGVAIISVVGVAYYLVYPPIRVGTTKSPTSTLIY